MIGQEIGSYVILSKLGQGGMGAVYLAEHKLLGRKVAVKVLLPEFAMNRKVVARLFNEAKATTLITHPGIVAIYDFGYLQNGAPYIVMEYLLGESLAARRKRLGGKLPFPEVVMLMRQIASALTPAHARGIIHRDLKPDNLFLVPDPEVTGAERVKILDFGIAKLLDPGEGPMPETRPGAMMGTPTYMSPEQCGAATKIDHRADLYALGGVCFHLLCGRPPFDKKGLGEIVAAHLYTKPPAPSSLEPAVPPTLDAIILKLLEKKPGDRYQSTEELVAALDELAASPAMAGQVRPAAHLSSRVSTASGAMPALTPVPEATPAPPAAESGPRRVVVALAPPPPPEPESPPESAASEAADDDDDDDDDDDESEATVQERRPGLGESTVRALVAPPPGVAPAVPVGAPEEPVAVTFTGTPVSDQDQPLAEPAKDGQGKGSA